MKWESWLLRTPIANLIADQYDAQPGNYLAFFSSYEYLRRAASVFSGLYPRIPTWEHRSFRRPATSMSTGSAGPPRPIRSWKDSIVFAHLSAGEDTSRLIYFPA